MTVSLALLPSFLLVAGLLAVLLADVLGRGQRPLVLPWISGTALVAAAVAAAIPLFRGMGSEKVLLGGLRMDSFALTLTAFCAATGFVSLLSTYLGEGNRRPGAEFHALVLGSVVGMSILSAATDLVTLYLAFETVSIAGYVLVGMRRADPVANEASLKYVLFGAVSSGVLIYGLSLVYGLAGGTSLQALQTAVSQGAAGQPAFVLALLFVFAGFAFKISAVPFHFWAPDVYQGAPAAIAGFLAVASKAAGFAALVRFAGAAGTYVEDAESVWTVLPWDSPMAAILAVSAVVTMTVGNLAACRQNDLKRLLAWSSIAHAGYMLMALAVWSRTGVEAVVFYLVTYLFMNLAAFLLAGVVARDAGTSDMSALRGLAFRHPWLAGALAIVMLSLTGLPPMLGFLGKWVLFAAVLERGYLWLAVIGLLNGAISLYYYAHPLFRMYFQDPDPARPTPVVRPARAAVVLACVLVVPLATVFLYWNPLIEWVRGIVPAGMFPT